MKRHDFNAIVTAIPSLGRKPEEADRDRVASNERINLRIDDMKADTGFVRLTARDHGLAVVALMDSSRRSQRDRLNVAGSYLTVAAEKSSNRLDTASVAAGSLLLPKPSASVAACGNSPISTIAPGPAVS